MERVCSQAAACFNNCGVRKPGWKTAFEHNVSKELNRAETT